jgi:hypothetical protein
MKSTAFTILMNPSEDDVSKLLAQAGSAGLRGIEGYSSGVHVWRYEDATHMMVASMVGIPYDPAADFVDKLTGKTFYVRSLEDWMTRERRRADPDSFTSKCRNADQSL